MGAGNLREINWDLACPFTLQGEEEEDEEEELPVEEIAMVPRARRSTYAFSHQEGYAKLITQGTIMRSIITKSTSEGPSTSLEFGWIVHEHQVTLLSVEHVIPGGE